MSISKSFRISPPIIYPKSVLQNARQDCSLARYTFLALCYSVNLDSDRNLTVIVSFFMRVFMVSTMSVRVEDSKALLIWPVFPQKAKTCSL